MPRTRKSFVRHHSLSIASLAILLLWIVLYRRSGDATHLGSLFGNAITDWTGVLVMVIATKYFYERGSAESLQPRGRGPRSYLRRMLRSHSLTLFLVITGIG